MMKKSLSTIVLFICILFFENCANSLREKTKQGVIKKKTVAVKYYHSLTHSLINRFFLGATVIALTGYVLF